MSEPKARHELIRPVKENHLEVVGAVIFRVIFKEGPEILAFQRKDGDTGGGKWEFPGGKREIVETFEEALLREMHEELGVKGEIEGALGVLTHHYPQCSIDLHLFLFKPDSWNFCLEDHQALIWLNEEQAKRLDWAAADVPWLPKVFATLRQLKV